MMVFSFAFPTDLDLKDIIIVCFLAVLSDLILLSNIKTKWKKLFSRNPEFEISNNLITIFDNSNYKEILIKEIEQLEIIKYRKDTFLGIGLNSSTKLKSNISLNDSRMTGILIDKYRWIVFDLHFASIEPKRIKEIIEKRMASSNKYYE